MAPSLPWQHPVGMIINTYIEALLADEIAADDIWQQWNERQLNDDQAVPLWSSIAVNNNAKTVSGSP
jgi:hypothetical protein